MNYTQNGIKSIKLRQFDEAFNLLNEGFFKEGESESGCYLAQMYFDVKITPRTKESLYKAMMLWYSTMDTTPSSMHKLGVNLYTSKNRFAKEMGLNLIKTAAENGYLISYGFLGMVAYKKGLYDVACDYFEKYSQIDEKTTILYAESLSKKSTPDIELAEKLFIQCAERFGQAQAYVKLAEIYTWNVNLKKRLIYLMKATDFGDVNSCATLAELLHNVDNDLLTLCNPKVDSDTLLLKYYSKADALKIPAGTAGLGRLYADGRGVTENKSLALKLYNKAQKMGYDVSFDRGLLFFCQNDYDRAYYDLKKAYEKGYSCIILLFYSAYNMDTKTDESNIVLIKTAFECEEIGLQKEEVNYILGCAYYFDNNVVESDVEKALSYFVKCPNIPQAAYVIGRMGAYGETNAVSPTEAESFLLTASENNIVDAMLILAKLYDNWNLYTKSVNLLMRAYSLGCKEAALEISRMYREGYVTGRKDKKKAKEWDLKAQN